MFEHVDSEANFQRWLKENFPSLALKDWRVEKTKELLCH